MMTEEHDPYKCTICGKEFKWVGMSHIEGVCLKCMMEDDD